MLDPRAASGRRASLGIAWLFSDVCAVDLVPRSSRRQWAAGRAWSSPGRGLMDRGRHRPSVRDGLASARVTQDLARGPLTAGRPRGAVASRFMDAGRSDPGAHLRLHGSRQRQGRARPRAISHAMSLRRAWRACSPAPWYTGEMAEDAAARAQRRRDRWLAGVTHTRSEALRAEIAFWRRATPTERLSAIRQMVDEAWLLKGAHGSPPRLQRSAGGIRRRER